MYRKLIKKHPVACAFFAHNWLWVIVAIANDLSVAKGLLLVTFVPTIYMEPNEMEKAKGWMRSLIFLVGVFVVIEILGVISGNELLEESVWFAWGLALCFLAFQAHKLWNWDAKYRNGIRRFFDQAAESNE